MVKVAIYTLIFLCVITGTRCLGGIEEQALEIKLERSSSHASKEALDCSEEAMAKVRTCEYDQALMIIMDGLVKYPHSFLLQSDFASLLGDYAQSFTANLKNRMELRSKQLLDKLMSELDNQPKDVMHEFKNEYYFRFALHREQYELGCSRVNEYCDSGAWDKLYLGYYCQGVGASNYAKRLLLDGQNKLALQYAKKAIIAWAQYFSHKNDYYNAYVHYALALGILGEIDEMLRALKRSASLIGKALDYHEFAEVIDFISCAQGNGLILDIKCYSENS